MNKEVVRVAVAYQVMEVTIEVDGLWRTYNTEAEQTVLVQLEGLYEVLDVGPSLFFAHGQFGNVDRSLSVAYHLYHTCSVGLELYKHGRMIVDGLLNSLAQRLTVCFHGERYAYRCII